MRQLFKSIFDIFKLYIPIVDEDGKETKYEISLMNNDVRKKVECAKECFYYASVFGNEKVLIIDSLLIHKWKLKHAWIVP